MALPDYARTTPGTAVIWGEAGAGGVTKTLSFDALASGSGRMGASADLGATFPEYISIQLIVESGTAPTAGGTVDLYLAWSDDNSTWPAGVSGSDAAWPGDGNEDEWAKQLGAPVTSLVATNDTDTVQVQNAVVVKTHGRYVTPVVDNNMDQAIRDEATATNNGSRIRLIPHTGTFEDS